MTEVLDGQGLFVSDKGWGWGREEKRESKQAFQGLNLPFKGMSSGTQLFPIRPHLLKVLLPTFGSKPSTHDLEDTSKK